MTSFNDVMNIGKGLPKLLNMNDVWNVRKNNLIKLSHDVALQVIEIQIIKHIGGLFNIERTISKEQIELVSELIMEEYPDLVITEIGFVIKKAAKGNFGPVYATIDPATILSWFKTYYEARANLFADYRERDYQSEIRTRKDHFMDEDRYFKNKTGDTNKFTQRRNKLIEKMKTK